MKKIEHIIEQGLFTSRWLMAPFYIGLVGALVIMLYSFIMELIYLFSNLQGITPDKAILGALSLIDLSLGGNLLLIVIFSGYENFVSKFDIGDHKDRPEWQGTVDFFALKLKIVASVVAISSIYLLKVFMHIRDISNHEIMWATIIHIVFVVSALLLAFMEKVMIGNKLLKLQYNKK